MEKQETCTHYGPATHNEPNNNVAFHGNMQSFGAMRTEIGMLSYRSAIADLEASVGQLKLTSDCQVVERICRLLSHHGHDLETQNKNKLDELFKTLKSVAGSTRVDVQSRLRLLQLFKLRTSGWGRAATPDNAKIHEQRGQSTVHNVTGVSCATTTIPPSNIPQSTTNMCSTGRTIVSRYMPTTSVCSTTTTTVPRYGFQNTYCTTTISPWCEPISTTSVCSTNTTTIPPRYVGSAEPKSPMSTVTLILTKLQAEKLILKGKVALQDVCVSCQVEVAFHQEATSKYIKAVLSGHASGVEEARVRLYKLIQEDDDTSDDLRKHEETMQQPKPEKGQCSKIELMPIPKKDIHVENEHVPGFFLQLNNENKNDSRWKRTFVPKRALNQNKECSSGNDVDSEVTVSKKVYSREFLLSCWHHSSTHTVPSDLIASDILVSDMRWQPSPFDVLKPTNNWRDAMDTGISFTQSRRMFTERKGL
ncbi:uncharacterized protein LOC117117151 [Anneissia japonica]|uniref:uncharacterized protein LOC117117151 n=1 Tax=Anneissia japonica TaxID=1529436 RepID=UPI001425AEBA|nr:uncharacterized protein LOC117117151 [Anneissia japonica]